MASGWFPGAWLRVGILGSELDLGLVLGQSSTLLLLDTGILTAS